jgi:Zn finger protein HypA/HybF involved in hydrogenase expression
MHESSLIENLIEQVAEHVREQKASRVVSVELLQGALDSSGADHLRAHFTAAAPGTVIEGAELRVKLNPDPLSSGIILQSIELER